MVTCSPSPEAEMMSPRIVTLLFWPCTRNSLDTLPPTRDCAVAILMYVLLVMFSLKRFRCCRSASGWIFLAFSHCVSPVNAYKQCTSSFLPFPRVPIIAARNCVSFAFKVVIFFANLTSSFRCIPQLTYAFLVVWLNATLFSQPESRVASTSLLYVGAMALNAQTFVAVLLQPSNVWLQPPGFPLFGQCKPCSLMFSRSSKIFTAGLITPNNASWATLLKSRNVSLKCFILLQVTDICYASYA